MNTPRKPAAIDFTTLQTDSAESVNFTPVEHSCMQELLSCRLPSAARRKLEAAAATAYSFLPESVRLGWSSMVKKQADADRLHQDLNRPAAEEIREIARKLRGKTIPAVIVTHDVDYTSGYRAIEKIAALEAKKGIFASYNFIVHGGYKLDPLLLRSLVSMRHEVGLHAYTYDLRLVYRSPAAIKKQLCRGKAILEQLLGSAVFGFRNHSLMLSHDLLGALQELGFLYDTGLFPRTRRDNFSLHFCWPFRYQNSSLYEIPVVWPLDTELFRALNFSNEAAHMCYKKRIELTKSLGGVFCFNHHPEIISERGDYYEQLLDSIVASDMPTMTPISYVQARRAAESAACRAPQGEPAEKRRALL